MTSLIEHTINTRQDITKWAAVGNMLGLTVGNHNEEVMTIRKGPALLCIYASGRVTMQDCPADDELILTLLKKLKDDDNDEQQTD